MPRNATKAADNVFYLARKAAEKCNDCLGSREGAAEETGIDRTRLARIEAGVLVPYPEEILMMAHTYLAPQLCNHYCANLCPLGKKTIPPCELLQIDRLALKVMSAMQGASCVQQIILEIAGDGQITQDEVPQLEQVMKNLEAMERASMELRLWMQKYIGQQEGSHHGRY